MSTTNTIAVGAAVVAGGVVAALSANNIGYSLIAGGVTYFAVNALTTPPKVAAHYLEADASSSKPKKEKKAAAGKKENKKAAKKVEKIVEPEPETEEDESEAEPEPEVKPAKKGKKAKKEAAAPAPAPVPAKKEEKKPAAAAAAPAKKEEPKKDDKKKGKKAAPAPAPESDDESDEESSTLSKSQQKRLKKTAATTAATPAAKLTPAQKKAADAAEAEKKAKKQAKEAAKKAEIAAKAAAALDNEGWTEVEKAPQRSASKKAAEVAAAAAAESDDEPEIVNKTMSVEINVPSRAQPIVIGAGGETLKKLVAATGAKIDMPKRDSGSSTCTITGEATQVAAAQHAITSLIERGYSSITHPGTQSDDLRVDEKKIGFIIGPKGVFLKAIQSKTNTRINLPDKGAAHPDRVSIIGLKDDVKRAKQALKDLITDGFCDLTHEGWIKSELEYPKDKLSWLIGPKGHTIKSIQGNTRTQIKIPEKNATPCIVTIIGTPAGVTQAQKEIGRLLEPIVTVVEDEDDIPQQGEWAAQETAQGDDALW